MGHGYAETGHLGEFEVILTNPSGNVIQFEIQDPSNLLQTQDLIVGILRSAVEEFIEFERADLTTNNDPIAGETPYYPGDGFANFVWNIGAKTAQYTLVSKTGIDVTQTYTIEPPYATV